MECQEFFYLIHDGTEEETSTMARFMEDTKSCLPLTMNMVIDRIKSMSVEVPEVSITFGVEFTVKNGSFVKVTEV